MNTPTAEAGLILRAAEHYAELVHGFKPDTPEHTLAVTSFGAGAAMLFRLVIHALSPGEEPTAADLAFMHKIDAECNEIGAGLDATFLERFLKRARGQ